VGTATALAWEVTLTTGLLTVILGTASGKVSLEGRLGDVRVTSSSGSVPDATSLA